MSKNTIRRPLFFSLAFCLLFSAVDAGAVQVVRYVSREDPLFNVRAARMAVGRDGRVYLWHDKYVLRINRDGTEKLGSEVTYALTAATANAEGTIATGNAHFSHSVNLWSPKFERLGAVTDFLNNDQVEYLSPGDVQAGASGDFFGWDQNQNRILRVAAPGRLVTAYSLADLGEDMVRRIARFRVWEKGKRFYLLCPSGTLRVVGFDGVPLWTLKPNIGGNPWDGWHGAFDVADDGRLLILEDTADTVSIFAPDGSPAGELKLQMGRHKGRVADMQFLGDDILVRRPDPIELFQVYDRQTGQLRRVVNANTQKVTLDLATDCWAAGEVTPATISVSPDAPATRLDWRFWLRPLNSPAFRELAYRDGAVTVPAEASGFCQLRVSPGRAGSADDYSLDAVVEVRRANAKGSVSVFTPQNRIYYGQGERIPVSITLRTDDTAAQTRVALKLLDGDRCVAQEVLPIGAGKAVQLALSPHFTAALRSGDYLLSAEGEGLSSAGQPLVIGSGLRRSPRFQVIQHGDYADAFPKSGPFDSPEQVSAHLNRSRKLGINLFVDRLGSPIGPLGIVAQTITPVGLADRAQADLRSPSPEKVLLEGPVRQTVAGYGAFGIQEQAILLNMDAGLPVGTSFDARTPEQFAEAIGKVTTALHDYPALRGWSWAANWWLGKLGAEAASTPEQKLAYQAALKLAKESGVWNPVLDDVSDTMLGHAVAAERQFRQVLDKAAAGKLSDMTGPYRAVGVVPPMTFRNADEVDLHYQAEQIQPPQVTPHQVDFYKRPGKRAWGHPELWNDDGTGGMIYPTLLQMVMRGADGIGSSGNMPAWPIAHDDPRTGGPGTASVYRGLTDLLRTYGPWHTTTHNADRVAIVASSRMLRIDDWSKIGGWYFDRLYEAYNACLYAHRPASFVFAEDATADCLTQYGAVLVVAQRVEIDGSLSAALKTAQAAGVPVYRDSTCQAEMVAGFTPLGFGFDKLLAEPSAWQDDSAYERFPKSFMEQAAMLAKALAAVPPVAVCDEPAVMLTERQSGEARFVWAVNNVPIGFDPGLAWRVGLLISQRAPLATRLTLNTNAGAIYDVFALRKLSGRDVEADLRAMPARLYAMLPAPIEKVIVRGPSVAAGGKPFEWRAAIADAAGKPFAASLPIRIRLLAADGSLLDEEYTSADREGATGSFVVPYNAPAGPVTIEAVELISGLSARLTIRTEAVGGPIPLTEAVASAQHSAPAAADAAATDNQPRGMTPAEDAFGPHFRSIVASTDGATVLLSAFNWGQNLYALDAQTGDVRWQGRVGHHYAYSPLATERGFGVQGFDLNSAEGYHLYCLDTGGQSRRRFALYGLPKRATAWAAGAHVLDTINHFAAAPDGSWVASAGDLGLALWDSEGTLLWSVDRWQTERKRTPLIAVDNETLLVLDGVTAVAHSACTGKELWRLSPTASGALVGGAVSGDCGTIALRSSGDGGRVFVVRGQGLVGTAPTLAEAVALSQDGESLVTVNGKQLRWHSADGALVWDFPGDDVLRNPVISRDGQRVCVGSEIGTLYVLGRDGDVLISPDLKALSTATWMPDGGLIAANWNGSVVRYDSHLKETWRTLPRPTVRDMRPDRVAAESIATTRRDGWGNAAKTALPLTANLLRQANALITAVCDPPAHEDPRRWQNKIELLTDGLPDAPEQPWLSWTDINMIDSGWRAKLVLQVDMFRTRLRVNGVTFVEDPDHPESWLRDVRLQWWDARDDRWRDGPYLVSDTAIHSHQLDAPIEAARFRFVSTGGGSWPNGNVRLGEIAFHGEILGCSHPDVAAKRAVAVLFDEREDDLSCLKHNLPRVEFQPIGAYSGGKCLALTAEGRALPNWLPPFGHAVPNWDFEIVEHPQPGQYRYLRFAWKAASDQTTGMSLLASRAWPGGGVAMTAGKYHWNEGVMAAKSLAEHPPADWQVVDVDLWDVAKQPLKIQALGLAAEGGGALFDYILLGRSMEELNAFERR